MAFDSFRDFVGALENAGELTRITQPLATELEITELADREMKRPGGGKALLIEKPLVNGVVSPIPLAVNTLGSQRRMALSLGADSVEAVAAELGTLMKASPPTSFREAIKLLGTALDLRHAKPKSVKEGPCQEVVHRFEAPATRAEPWPPAPSVDHPPASSAPTPTLLNLPIQKCWPLDGGRFITLPGVVTRDPDTGARNVGMYRMQVYDDRTTGMHWQLQKVGARHGRRYYETGRRMPVSVFLGGDPVFAFCATAPLPDGLDEFLLAGYLRRKSVALVKCLTNDLEVPANADIVLEGYVDPQEPLREEGPFGDHTGYYSLPDFYPVFHLTCITHRKNPIYAATNVGKPPMEDTWLAKAVERIFLPALKMTIPEVVDINLPPEGVAHNLMLVSIRKSYPGQARKVMNAIWSLGQAMFTKCIVVVDEDCDVQNVAEVVLRVANNIDPERDIQFTLGPVDSLDHSSRLPNYGSKMGIDATRKWKAEGFTRPWPAMIEMDRTTKARVDELWAKLGL